MIESKKISPFKLKILFMGTSVFSQIILRELIDNKYHVSEVFTQPDKRSGRNTDIIFGPIKKYCAKNKLNLHQPNKLNEVVIESISKMAPDIIVVAAYGKILPQSILDIPRFGCLNIHASLLPKYRGASPIQNALLQGEKKTGITLIRMDKNIDTGDILSQAEIEIDSDDTTETLSLKLAELGADQILETLPLWIQGKIIPQKQDDSRSILCQLIKRGDGHIFWNEKAADIYNKFRAFQPWPGVFCFWRKKETLLRLKLNKISLSNKPIQQIYPPGMVFSVEDVVLVQTTSGAIILEEVQLEGKRPIAIKEFINGQTDFIGSKLN